MTATARDLDLVTRRLKALADASRLQIVDRLRGGERCVCELTDALDTGQSLLSFRLRRLREAGLVRDRREGRWVYYTLNVQALRECENFLASLAKRTSKARWAPVCCP